MKKIRSIFFLLVLFSISLFVFTGIANSIGIYAALNTVEPTSVLNLGSEDKNFDWMFHSNSIGGTKIAPGEKTVGILRIVNNTSSRYKISGLGGNFQLYKNNDRILYDSDSSYSTQSYAIGNEFMQRLNIEIDYLNPLDGLLRNKLYHDTLQNFTLGVNWNYTLGQGKYIDLVYTISFDETADASIAGIKAISEFLVTTNTLDSTFDNTNTGNIANPSSTQLETQTEEIIDIENELTPLGSAEISGHFAEEEILLLVKLGIISGYPDGTIRPDWNITRAEVASLLFNVLKLPMPIDDTSFYKDTLPMWAKSYILSNTEYDIFTGYPDKTFRANHTITRQEVVAVLAKAIQLDDFENITLPFSDVTASTWGINYIKSLYDIGVINGYPDGTFRPDSEITRAEMFSIIAHLIELNYLEGGTGIVNTP